MNWQSEGTFVEWPLWLWTQTTQAGGHLCRTPPEQACHRQATAITMIRAARGSAQSGCSHYCCSRVRLLQFQCHLMGRKPVWQCQFSEVWVLFPLYQHTQTLVVVVKLCSLKKKIYTHASSIIDPSVHLLVQNRKKIPCLACWSTNYDKLHLTVTFCFNAIQLFLCLFCLFLSFPSHLS